MNFDFLRFEAKLLRLLLGATFVIQAAMLAARWTDAGWRWSAAPGVVREIPGELAGGTLFLILALFAALAGARVLDGIALLATWLARRMIRAAGRTPTLLLDPTEMARRIIVDRKECIREYHRLRGIGYATGTEHHRFLTRAIGRRLLKVERLAASAPARDWEVMTSIIHFGTLTVEQAITERLNERIATLKALWIVLATTGVLALEFLAWSVALLIAITVLLLAALASVAAFAAAKRDAAHHWVYLVYDSIGQFAAGAEETGTAA